MTQTLAMFVEKCQKLILAETERQLALLVGTDYDLFVSWPAHLHDEMVTTFQPIKPGEYPSNTYGTVYLASQVNGITKLEPYDPDNGN